MLEMLIDSIRVSLMNYQRVVILKERGADRYLPIWIGSPEADAIAVKLQDVSVPRPLTHDLIGSVIGALGATVEHVTVTDLSNDTFFAKLVLRLADGTQTEVDCRPSDAIAIAVRGGQLVEGQDGEEHWFPSSQEAEEYLRDAGIDPGEEGREVRSKVPIFVEETVLEKAGVAMDQDSVSSLESGTSTGSPRKQGRRPVSDEEIKRLSAFSDFLDELPGLEDLGESQ